jgi:hypothetical protein
MARKIDWDKTLVYVALILFGVDCWAWGIWLLSLVFR